MNHVEIYLRERIDEMSQHLALLRRLDTRAAEGVENPDQRVEVRQVLILKSSVLVHLYNIVEATMNRALDKIAENASRYHPKNYTDAFLEEWMRKSAGTHDGASPDKLLKNATTAARQLVQNEDWNSLTINRGYGNWDDIRISRLSARLGVQLHIDETVRRHASEHYRNGESRFVYLRNKRNGLAHGFETFEDGANDRTADELTDLAKKVLDFMLEVIKCFDAFDQAEGFLRETEEAA